MRAGRSIRRYRDHRTVAPRSLHLNAFASSGKERAEPRDLGPLRRLCFSDCSDAIARKSLWGLIVPGSYFETGPEARQHRQPCGVVFRSSATYTYSQQANLYFAELLCSPTFYFFFHHFQIASFSFFSFSNSSPYPFLQIHFAYTRRHEADASNG